MMARSAAANNREFDIAEGSEPESEPPFLFFNCDAVQATKPNRLYGELLAQPPVGEAATPWGLPK